MKLYLLPTERCILLPKDLFPALLETGLFPVENGYIVKMAWYMSSLVLSYLFSLTVEMI
jgi:hypothetical protein